MGGKSVTMAGDDEIKASGTKDKRDVINKNILGSEHNELLLFYTTRSGGV